VGLDEEVLETLRLSTKSDHEPLNVNSIILVCRFRCRAVGIFLFLVHTKHDFKALFYYSKGEPPTSGSYSAIKLMGPGYFTPVCPFSSMVATTMLSNS